MSTPQNPGGDTPQDPQNPYGSTPPPEGTPPPAAPADPAAAPPPAYGQPAYGQPAYGQPAAGQPGYPQPGQPGQPGFPQYGAPATNEPSKGMAITALILSFFGLCVVGALVAIPLAIVVLLRGRDGRNHGKGLAISAIVISIVTLGACIALVVGLGLYASQFEDVNDLKAGECITAKGLTDESADSVTEIKSVSCSDKHDGEVLAAVELSADQAENYTDTQSEEICAPAIEAEGKTAVLTEDITVTALTVTDPSAGDNVACVAYHVDGSDMTGKLGS